MAVALTGNIARGEAGGYGSANPNYSDVGTEDTPLGFHNHLGVYILRETSWQPRHR